MAENKSAVQKNDLGELFIKLGIGGVKNLLKELNTVQAQFLLTKNAAEQFAKPLINMSRSAGEYVTSLDKINAVTGITSKQLQDLEIWSKLNNVSFGELTNQLGALQQNLLKIRLGQGDISGFQLIGLDPTLLDYKDPIKALDQIRQKIIQLDEPTQRLAIRQLGLSDNLLYAWKQENKLYNERLKLTDAEMDKSREQQKLWNSLDATWESSQRKFVSNQQWINTLLKNSIELLGTFTEWLIKAFDSETMHNFANLLNVGFDNLKTSIQWLQQQINELKKSELGETFKDAAHMLGQSVYIDPKTKKITIADYNNIPPDIRYKSEKIFDIKNPLFTEINRSSRERTLTSEEAAKIRQISAEMDNYFRKEYYKYNNIQPPAIPTTSLSSLGNSSNYQVQITNYITGDNPQEIGQQTSERVSSVFELTNNPVV